MLVWGAALAMSGTSLAEPPAKPPAAPAILRPCDARGEQGREAKALLWKARAASEESRGTETLASSIHELMDHPCLALPLKELGEPVTGDPRALVDWYGRGGRSWLDWATHTSKASRQLQLPPSFRPWLEGDRLPANHPLKSVVCATSEPSCGQETAGWLWRQDRYPRRSWSGCQQADSYRAFLDCVHHYLPTACLYPGGRFHRPDRGLFVWSNLGGRSSAWVFDLQTGQALRYRSEPRTVQEVPWSTSRFATGETVTRTRRMAVPGRVLLEVGPIARDNLHEAVLALLLSRHSSPGLRGAYFKVFLPELEREFDPAAPLPGEGGLGGLGAGTRYRRRAWSYLPDGKKVALRLPLEGPQWTTGDRGHRTAASAVNPRDLMQIVELGFRPTRTVVLTQAQGNQVYETISADRPRALVTLLQGLAAE